MKKLFVFVPVVLLVLFLFNSFVMEEKKAGAKTSEGTTSGPANVVFKSTDGGQTWQDISKGLPEDLREDSIRGNSFFANDKGLFLKVGNGIYHSTLNATGSFWSRENLPYEPGNYIPANSGISDYNYWSANLKNADGTSVWSPIFENIKGPRLREVFETADGTIFIGTDRGFFKTDNSGKTWRQVHAGELVGHLAESDGILLAISNKKIIRSTDKGENWDFVNNEDSVYWDVKQINGGFAALNSVSSPDIRGISTSFDGGKTWQPDEAGRKDKVLIDSIWRTWNDRPHVQGFMTPVTRIGENFFSIHPEGIFRSSDNGKTWKLLLPSVKNKVFNLFISGNVIYAISRKGGC